MKKAAAAVLLILLFSSAGCGSRETVPELKIGSSAVCSIDCGTTEYKCTISVIGDDVEKITMTSPETVQGISFGRYKGSDTVSMGSLICRSEGCMLPAASVPSRLRGIMKRLRTEREEIKLFPDGAGYSGEPFAGVRIITDENGVLTQIISDG